MMRLRWNPIPKRGNLRFDGVYITSSPTEADVAIVYKFFPGGKCCKKQVPNVVEGYDGYQVQLENRNIAWLNQVWENNEPNGTYFHSSDDSINVYFHREPRINFPFPTKPLWFTKTKGLIMDYDLEVFHLKGRVNKANLLLQTAGVERSYLFYPVEMANFTQEKVLVQDLEDGSAIDEFLDKANPESGTYRYISISVKEGKIGLLARTWQKRPIFKKITTIFEKGLVTEDVRIYIVSFHVTRNDYYATYCEYHHQHEDDEIYDIRW